MEEEGSRCEAFVVKDGKFAFCGSSEEAAAAADEVIDLKGANVLPGLIDSHHHLYAYACILGSLTLDHVKSMQELKDTLREYSKHVPKGEWIFGFGFENEAFTDDKRLPTKEILDEACPDHPVLINRWCMHFFSANSLALKAAGIDRDFVPEVEGTVIFGEDGEPTGVLSDSSAQKVSDLVPPSFSTIEKRMDAVENAIKKLNEKGLTGVHPVQGRHVDLMEYMNVYQELDLEGRLNIRVYLGYDELPNMDLRSGLGDEMVKYGYYKLFLDGAFGGHTAAMIEPYSDDPGNTGVLNYTQEELNDLICEAGRRHLQTGVHVIGDKAGEMLITAIETAKDKGFLSEDARFRMIHLQLLNEDMIARVKKLPVVVDTQPVFIHTDMRWIEDRVGEERMKYMNPWKRLIDEGMILTAGSDSPGADFDPWLGMFAAVNRTSADGFPEGGSHMEHALSVYEALCMYTKNAAYASFEEDIKGSIREGKLADFIIVDRDIFKCPATELKDVKVLSTFLGGRNVFEADE